MGAGRLLRRNAFTVDGIRQIAVSSRFGGGEIREDGIGFELVLSRAWGPTRSGSTPRRSCLVTAPVAAQGLSHIG
jgi:hypothetical protein